MEARREPDWLLVREPMWWSSIDGLRASCGILSRFLE